MPFAKIVKELKRKMASMQSPRTQCCCCAVGVFAAMFGIFMLSAGICIVLNVNYMEVDTSGLPPDLHNEDGKRIVGIILICVSICTLGLSATVSIIYFAFCNRSNPRHAAVASSSAAAGTNNVNHSNGSVQQQFSSSVSNPANNIHHPYPNNKHVTKVAAMHGGGGTGGSRSNLSGSQTPPNSLSAAKQRRQAAGSHPNILLPTPSHGQSPSAGSKRGRRNIPKKGKTRIRNKNKSFALPTHTEEDPEAAKSVVDLKSHRGLASTENSSNSGSGMAPSQIGSTITDDSRNPAYSTTSFMNAPPSIKASPVIIIDGPSSPAISPNPSQPSLTHTTLTTAGNDGSYSNYNSENSIVNDEESAVVYNENEIARTTEKITSSSSTSTSSPSTHTSQPYSSIVHSNSNKKSHIYSNPTFEYDNNSITNNDNVNNTNDNNNISNLTSSTILSLDHDASEYTTDDTPSSTPPLSDRLTPPLRQLPTHSSSVVTTTATSSNGTGNAAIATYPTPLISAGLDLGDETEQNPEEGPQSTGGNPDPTSSSTHNILQVKPHHRQNPSDPTAITAAMQAESSNPSEKSLGEEDFVSDLPQSSRHHDRYHNENNRRQYTVNISNNNIDNAENRSESRSSFNSTFSTDGEERDDLERMQEKMKELLK